MVRNIRLAGITLILSLLLVACGGTSSEPDTPEPTPSPFPTFEYVQPTEVAEIVENTEDETEAEPTVDMAFIERGRGRYDALECGTCHGENREGTDDGSALTDFAMDEEAFISFMLSGGELGAEHQYSTDRLSDRSSRALYQYLVYSANGTE